MRIDYEMIELPQEKNIELIECYFELFDNHLTWHAKFHSEMLNIDGDIESGFVKMYRTWDQYVKRENICSVQKTFVYRAKVWKVEIEINGAQESIYLYLQKNKTGLANKITDIFFKYMMGESVDNLEMIWSEKTV